MASTAWLKYALLAIAATLVIIVFRFFDPEESEWFLRCPFQWLTGLQCPACGGQRALHALLNGEFGKALSYNPFFVISVPYATLVACAAWVKPLRKSPLRLLLRPAVVYTYVALLVAWWVIRNLPFYCEA